MSLLITQSRLMELMSYDSDTGLFTWIKKKSQMKPGMVAGSKNVQGYIAIKVDCHLYLAHRLIWLYVHGAFPSSSVDIDHINCIKHDNRLSNLRESTRSQNQCNVRMYSNNTSGYKGVCWSKQKNKFIAHIKKNYKTYHIGMFETAHEAHVAYLKAAETFHGEFAYPSGDCK
jgi:hypothetical protein